ncbi:MAG: hypothetical protein LUG44_03850 [Clostridiales bacterium]|nr:hypothetical protein [Clostridiales bacterium]
MADTITPITRAEIYAAAIASGVSENLPTPITRLEHYLYYMAANGVGGGVTEEDLEEIKAALTETMTEIQAEIAESVEYALLSGLDGTAEGYKSTMRLWFRAHGSDDATPAELTALCDKWYNLTRPSWDGNVTFYQPDVSAVSTGTKGGDNAGLTCTPSTDTVANQDDYAGLPLFACVDCNWELDPDTLQPLVTAIDGINDSFTRYDPETYVGVLQMSGYHYWYDDDTAYTHGYTATAGTPYANMEPVPEAVNPDGTFRQWVLHSKYMSKTVDGKMTSYSGAIPTAFTSHNTLHTHIAANGDGYSGGTTADYSWLVLMAYIKYGSLTLDGILQGCCNMNYQYIAQVAEEGVSRIILSTANAANLEVGMSVILGNYAGNTDRGQAAMYSISGNGGCRITAIETVTIDDAEYSAVYVDLEDTFDTAANGSAVEGTTYLSTWHWATGSCDGVLGNDGSPTSCTSGKYPAKLQGIEYMVGGYEVAADVILNLYLSDETYYYEPYIVRLRANQSTSITSNYVATGLIIAQPETAAWNYIKKLQYAMGVFFPEEVGGSSSTYTRDAFYQNATTTGTREWLAFGYLSYGSGLAGLSHLTGDSGLSYGYWSYLARLSPNGNRGELAA